jgi:penicillin-binding protein 1A
MEVRGCRLRSVAILAIAVPVLGWAAAGLALAEARLIWTIVDGSTAVPPLESGPQATILFDRSDRLVFSLHEEARIDVPLERVSPHLVSAVLAIEDNRFYRHHGLDPIRILGAAWANVRAGRIVEGGSTITQQLVRVLKVGTARTWRRKIREAMAATDLEARHGKPAILETYLNTIYLGDGYYGVEAAARGYFGKTAADLRPTEAALIAALVRSPARSPRTQPAGLLARRNLVLRRMWDHGYLQEEAYRRASASALAVRPRDEAELTRLWHDPKADAERACGLDFYEDVRRQLVQLFGDERVLRDGLRVYTTIDPDLQRDAEQALRGRLDEIATLRRRAPARGGEGLEGALVAIDPSSGEVLALVGGRDSHRSRFNRAVQARRQPGSAFKPIIFAAALEQGYGPGSLLRDLAAPIAEAPGSAQTWLPAEEHEASEYTLRRALTVSSNRASAQLLQQVGVSSALLYAERLGIASKLPAVASLALGTGGVTLVELTSAYGAFANHGLWVAPIIIRRVEDRDGVVLWQPSVVVRQAVRPSTAYLMSSMLADVIARGTGYRVRSVLKRPAAGKTGTSDDYTDAWFVGYTPRLVAGVWVGFDRPATILRGGFGGLVAAPAWARFMSRATAAHPVEWFPAPADVERVELCRLTGARVVDGCREAERLHPEHAGVYADLFSIGSAPADPCPLHGVRAGIAEIAFSKNP